MDRRIDIALALAFALAGLVIIWQAALIRQGIMRDPVGPRAAFYLCGGILVAGGLVTALRNARALQRGEPRLSSEEGTADQPGTPAHLSRAVALAGTCFAYAALFNPLGYLIATPLFLMAALAVMDQRRWGINLVIAVLFTGLAYLVFSRGLGVRMPHGPLTDLFRQLGWINL